MPRMFAPIPEGTERVATAIIGAGIDVHRVLGRGFLERIYEEALCIEFQARGLAFERQRPITVHYRGVDIPGQRIDLIVAECVLVELKAVTRLDRAHHAKVISYLRTTGLRLGLLLNFNCETLKEGIQRIVV
ncbi:MAG: GxxExxY protein [Acidimicrobiia bacterium]|nr:GxxExxY protein [Acidimicrobiia bacterium]